MLNKEIPPGKMYVIRSVFIILIGFVISIDSFTQEQTFGVSERPGIVLSDSLMVFNEDSVPVQLSALITKPTLLVFVYYRCPALCPKMLDGVVELVNYTAAIPENDYQILTISIDPSESIRFADNAKQNLYAKLNAKVNPVFWRFLTADSLNIRAITDQVGWEFRNVNGQFIHTTSSILLSPDAMISQYFYGTYFNYMHFDLSVDKALKGEIVPTRLKNLKYCYNFVPEKNNYISIITKIFGILLIVVVGGLFIYLRFGGRKLSEISPND